MRSKVSVPLVLELPQNKLPTELQVLGFYLCLKKQKLSKCAAQKIAPDIVRAVMEIWNKAYIPYIKEQHIMRLLYFKENSIIRR